MERGTLYPIKKFHIKIGKGKDKYLLPMHLFEKVEIGKIYQILLLPH